MHEGCHRMKCSVTCQNYDGTCDGWSDSCNVFHIKLINNKYNMKIDYSRMDGLTKVKGRKGGREEREERGWMDGY